MWNLALGQEIILMVSIIVLLAWLMGRSLCTSKSYQARAKVKQLKNENQRLEKLIAKKDQELYENNEQLKNEKKRSADKEHQYRISHNTLKNKYDLNLDVLSNLQNEHKKSLYELQNLEDCAVKLNKLNELYREQSVDKMSIESNLEKLQTNLHDSNTLYKKLQKENTYLKVEKDQLSQDFSKQLNNASELQLTLDKIKKELSQTDSSVRVKNNTIIDYKDKNEKLEYLYKEQLAKNVELKESLKIVKDDFNEHTKLMTTLKANLDDYQSRCNNFQQEIETYKILLNVG